MRKKLYLIINIEKNYNKCILTLYRKDEIKKITNSTPNLVVKELDVLYVIEDINKSITKFQLSQTSLNKRIFLPLIKRQVLSQILDEFKGEYLDILFKCVSSEEFILLCVSPGGKKFAFDFIGGALSRLNACISLAKQFHSENELNLQIVYLAFVLQAVAFSQSFNSKYINIEYQEEIDLLTMNYQVVDYFNQKITQTNLNEIDRMHLIHLLTMNPIEPKSERNEYRTLEALLVLKINDIVQEYEATKKYIGKFNKNGKDWTAFSPYFGKRFWIKKIPPKREIY